VRDTTVCRYHQIHGRRPKGDADRSFVIQPKSSRRVAPPKKFGKELLRLLRQQLCTLLSLSNIPSQLISMAAAVTASGGGNAAFKVSVALLTFGILLIFVLRIRKSHKRCGLQIL
jgi:hypothetical protein